MNTILSLILRGTELDEVLKIFISPAFSRALLFDINFGYQKFVNVEYAVIEFIKLCFMVTLKSHQWKVLLMVLGFK